MGGSSSSRPLGDMRGLEERAKDALRGPNTFISFAHEDLRDVNLLRAQAKNENSDLRFADHSVREPYDSENAEYIRHQITQRLKRCSVTVVHLSPNIADSKWVRWEVEKSLELGKRVVVAYHGNKPGALPNWLSEKTVKVVSWSNLSKELRSDD